ncbi:T6SS phospholipase effector Tle1-like catalytic domain-containing protein [Xanthomonas graminis]|uniref:T6SS phospholipase effector Tle1-like catalytic domain-containing protein n=1 Tax=Xanthomonas graminis TaxID=3390026 RepID=UPI001F1E2DED|nr:DUF2235 domain-containing protein [Xanthomonas translucens]UKE71839.1 DUF2235 domain-containing protein [Xanthomonas translucens pv. phleipratensis]
MEELHDLIASLTASTNDVSKNEPNATQDCYDRLKISIFFDGTGNNRDADAEGHKWSNVARLFDASRREPNNGIYSYYISGVGTKLNQSEPWWKISKYIRDTSSVGGGAGIGVNSRLENGDLSMDDMLKRALEIATEKKGGEIKSIYTKNQSNGFQQLNLALSNHRLIKSIEVSIFGFSRGAALARAFVNRLIGFCKKENGTLTYQTYPITFNFLGIFDTVASMGRPARNDFKEVDLWLPSELQCCIHYVAAHELRYSFPVDLIRQGTGYPSNWKEDVFPGVHSDVGGGYGEEEQGRSNELARIPLMSMYRESLINGVRLFNWNKISNDSLLKKKFIVPQQVQSLFDEYMKYVGLDGQNGTIENRIKAHMKLWYTYKHAVSSEASSGNVTYQESSRALKSKIEKLNSSIFGIVRNGSRSQAELERARQLAKQRDETQASLDSLESGKSQIDGGQVTIAEEAAELLEKRKNNEPLKVGKIGASGHYVFESTAEAWMLDAYYSAPPKIGVITFFDKLVHDSKAGFLGGHEPFAYFRNRGVWESTNPSPVLSNYEQERQALQNQINIKGVDFSAFR